MLVLARQRDQAIMIGRDIKVRVVDIRGDKVRLGIEAPRDIPVHREEIHDAIRRENEAAAAVNPVDLTPLIAPPSVQPLRIVRDDAPANPFLQAAIDEAHKSQAEGGLPIGAVLVRGNEIIGRGHDHRTQRNDPLAFAEIDCLTSAGRQADYHNAVLYCTVVPSQLGATAVMQLSIGKVFVGASSDCCGKSLSLLRTNGIEVVDLHDRECAAMARSVV